jgi:general secretion pathway protein J
VRERGFTPIRRSPGRGSLADKPVVRRWGCPLTPPSPPEGERIKGEGGASTAGPRGATLAGSGFTLLELLIALSIVAALLAILLGGLRVGLAAWRQGEDRAEAHQHLRSLAELLSRSVAGTFPYRMPSAGVGKPTVQFQGDEERLAFVTLSPPFPLPAPIAFTAVTLAHEGGEHPGLTVREKPLPNLDPFEAVTPVFADPAVTAVTFRYLKPTGGWEARWDSAAEGGLPQAVEIRLATRLNGRAEPFPSLTITLRARLQ